MSTLRVDNLRGQTADGVAKYVVQMQSTTTTSSITVTATSLTASGLIVSITPKFANSNLLITITGGEQTYSGSGVITGVTHLYRQLTGGSYADLSG